MSIRSLCTILALGVSLVTTTIHAQADDMAAMMPPRPMARTADDQRIGLASERAHGGVVFTVPDDAYRFDLLNARGRVKRTVIGDVSELDIRGLKRGVWTLRAHTKEGILVRRFVVVKRSVALWALPNGSRRAR